MDILQHSKVCTPAVDLLVGTKVGTYGRASEPDLAYVENNMRVMNLKFGSPVDIDHSAGIQYCRACPWGWKKVESR